MSKNIIIQEGGVNKTLNGIKKIQTAKSGGGDVLWILEEDIKTGNKTIKKNGTYYAKTDGLTGYIKVSVNVPGGESKTNNDGYLVDDDGDTVDEDGNKTKDSGKDPVKPSASSGGDGETPGVVGKESDGNEYHYTTDKDGNIVKTKVPSSIVIVTPPDKTSYVEGQQIDYTGISVSTLDGNNDLMYTIPYSELIFTKHIVDQHSREEYHGNSWGANSEYIVSSAGTYLGENSHGDFYKYYDGDAIALWRNGQGEDSWRGPLLISPNPESTYYKIGNLVITSVDTITYDGVTWYVNYQYWTLSGVSASPLPTSEIGVGILGNTDTALAKKISLMTRVGAWGEGGAPYTSVPVNWIRPYDNKVLTDSFEITVTT